MRPKLRLLEEIKIIKDTAKEVFGEGIKVFIFGSRTDPKKRGGDIDILIKSPRQISTDEKLIVEEIKKSGGVGNMDLEDSETIKLVDAFIFRFMKLQDHVGNRLFKTFLIEIGEYSEELSFVDVLDRLEKLKIIKSSEDWLKLRKLRSKFAHEYPNEIEEITSDIASALDWVDEIDRVYRTILEYLKERKRLE